MNNQSNKTNRDLQIQCEFEDMQVCYVTQLYTQFCKQQKQIIPQNPILFSCNMMFNCRLISYINLLIYMVKQNPQLTDILHDIQLSMYVFKCACICLL